jgi:hypothetical protein
MIVAIKRKLQLAPRRQRRGTNQSVDAPTPIPQSGWPSPITRPDHYCPGSQKQGAEAKKAHPDVGGTAELFRQLVEARDRLLAALGTSAPAPKPPTYAPSGAHIVYRSVRMGAQGRLGHTRRLT